MGSLTIDIAVDFMDMSRDRHLWTRMVDARPGFLPTVGGHVTVGSEDSDLAVARVLSIDDEGHIELEVLPGSIDTNRALLITA